MKRTIFALLCAAVAISSVKAQDMSRLQSPVLHQQSFQVTAGTQGIGGEFIYGLLQQRGGRGGFSYIPLSMNNDFPVSGLTSDNKLTANFSNIHFLADFTPFKTAPFFRLVGGGGYFMQAKGDFA